MAVDLIKSKPVDETDAIPVSIAGKVVGFIGGDTWEEKDHPEYFRAELNPDDRVKEKFGPEESDEGE